MKFPVMIIAMIAMILVANFYVFFRLWQMMPPTVVGRVLLIAAAAICVSSFFIYFMIGNKASICLTTAIYKIGTSWIMILLYFFMLFVVVDLLRLFKIIPRDIFFHSWTAFIAAIGLISIVMTIGYITYRTKKRTELNITTQKTLEKSLKIVGISDLHLGYGIDKKEFRQWVELINAENPDAIIIAGDIVDTNIRPLIEQNMDEVFSEFNSRYGIFTILGNHEYISHSEDCIDFLEKSGINILKDETMLVDSMFYVVGRDDRTNHSRKKLAELVKGLDQSKPIILLDHQPYNLEQAEQNGIDLQFSGHTHHGQVWPISLITSAIYEVSYGHLKKGNADIYVSSGIGIWGGKFRIGSRSEYVVINITPQA